MDVVVVRSAKRRKTVEAKVVGDPPVIRVSVPSRMSRADEERWVATMVARLERRRSATPIDLSERAAALATRFDLPRPASIRWVDNQEQRWGSCTPVDGSIRVSTRVAGFPRWVLDGVLVHEMAHLVVHGHGPAFWAVANRYPLMERARGFLIAKGYGEED